MKHVTFHCLLSTTQPQQFIRSLKIVLQLCKVNGKIGRILCLISGTLLWDHYAHTEETTTIFIATQLTTFALEDIAESRSHGLDEESR